MTVQEAQQLHDIIFANDGIEALTAEESGALWALADAIDGSPQGEQLPPEDAELIKRCIAKITLRD